MAADPSAADDHFVFPDLLQKKGELHFKLSRTLPDGIDTGGADPFVRLREGFIIFPCCPIPSDRIRDKDAACLYVKIQ